ncbi:MAG: dipeptide/oligopeptide/nickel ABC transporter permease/ATP-binding protein [Pseudomonadota bacterium]
MKGGAARKLALPVTMVVLIVGTAALAPILPLADPTAIDIPNRFDGPSWEHPLGQDEFGRDELARIIWGGRASLAVAILSSLIAAAAGTALGLMGGYFRGAAEILTVRAAEVLLCLPPLLLALLVVTLLGSGATTLVIALSILYTPRFVRIAYAATLQTRSLDYVVAQEALGRHPVPILARTILPNISPPLLVQLSVTVASAMVIESGLSFLGLGVVPPAPSWGLMIRGARGAMDAAPLLLVWPCLALVLAIYTFNLLCDRLRDVLDPRAVALGAGGWLRALGGSTTLPATPTSQGLLEADHLTVRLGDSADATRLVRDVSFGLQPGQTVALVGESGSGKTLSGLAAMGLLPTGLSASGTRIALQTEGGAVNVLALNEPQMNAFRGEEIAMVFQDAAASLSPVMRVGKQIEEAVRAHHDVSAHDAAQRARSLLARVGMPNPERAARAWPHELSGGQRQRAMIAAAIANGPGVLIADEPTTALDPTIQAQILELLIELKSEAGAMIFVTHNLAIVAEIADRILVLYAGEVVEEGTVARVFEDPRHPYTAALIKCVPESGEERLVAIPGVVPAPNELPQGCRFAPRCSFATPRCCDEHPSLETTEDGRTVRCLRWREIP